MKALISVVAALVASPAFADGAYIGGFGSFGSYQALGWRGGPNPQRSSTMLGGFAGYGFQAGGLIISPEARLHVGTNRQTQYDENIPGFFGTRPAIYRYTFKENLGASVGLNVGATLGSFTPYVGASIGRSKFKFNSIYTNSGGYQLYFEDRYTFTNYSVRLGAEYNIDRYFLRAEVQHRWFRSGGWDPIHKSEANIGIGVRF
ncbi:outer membrane protein [Shinella oryzae]|uniref:Outer membrane beta-barrel protein n=1 Tax=Shinella oryzae TaxID=2871820 RepID=A0ABY9JZK0_9HYPH|nr:outer membrane beta-barrel protein [Shinella oryzae]WLS01748.1 outer membrane beta-barrel protein [Shinella oryzae]